MSDLPAKEESAPIKAHGKIRDVQKRDLMVVRHLLTDYPGFSELSPEDQFDRIVFVLESICGFGAVSIQTISQLDSVIKNVPKNLEDYIKNSVYHNVEHDNDRNKYRESFEGAFCLEREFKKSLAEEGEDSSSDEPIRKKVPAKFPRQVKTIAPAVPPSPAPTVTPSPIQELSLTAEVRKTPDHSLDNKPRLSTADVDKASEDSKKNPPLWMVFGATGVLVVLVIVAFLLK